MGFNKPQFQPQSGNRDTLNFNDRDILENKVLPTARRWLNVDGLRGHAEATLKYWGEVSPNAKQ